MEEPNKEKKEEKNFYQKFTKDDRVQKGKQIFFLYHTEFLSGALMLVGIILAFFYLHVGAMLVGLAFGICFFNEIQDYFVQLRDLYIAQGLFKTVMLIGTVLYLLLSIPSFVIAAFIGFGAIYLLRWAAKKDL